MVDEFGGALRCWINPSPARRKIEKNIRFNELINNQFHLGKPMQFHKFDVFRFVCAFLVIFFHLSELQVR